ncbi:MAG: tRNA dihydrouridine synthase DusB [Pirellulales bacterium]
MTNGPKRSRRATSPASMADRPSMPNNAAGATADRKGTGRTSACSVPALRIGPLLIDPPVLQAPMAGFTNYAFRQVVRQYGGAGLLATEMISARGYHWLQRHDQEPPDRLWGVRDEPRPLAVQVWDNDPEVMAEVGAALAHDFRVSVVDINFGCPVRQVTERAGSGSYLLRDPDRVGRIVERMVGACSPVPVTAKIRLGCTSDSNNGTEVAQVVEEAGGAALTVHGRTAEDFFRGRANWEAIAEIKGHLKRIPLIGNGDLDSPGAVVDVFRQYNVDGVMIARAALGRPWIFRQIAAALAGEAIPSDPTFDEQRTCLVDHFRLVCQRFGPEKGTVLMRKYACCYAQGRPGARLFRTHAAGVTTPDEFLQVVRDFFPQSTSDSQDRQ